MYHNLVLSGGSLKGIAIIGCLDYLKKQGLLENIVNYIGCSFGALLCFMLVIGMSTDEIMQEIKETTQNYRLDNVVDHLLSFVRKSGIDDGAFIINRMRVILQQRLKKEDITFIELAKISGKNLVICGANITKVCSVFFNVDSYPNMSVLTAVRISFSIPIIFKPIMFEECLYVDGALFNNFPIDYFDDLTNPLRNTIGVLINFNISMVKPNNIFSFMRNLLDAMLIKLNHKQLDNHRHNVIIINIKDNHDLSYDFEKMKFSLPSGKYDEYYNLGYTSAEHSFNSKEGTL